MTLSGMWTARRRPGFVIGIICGVLLVAATKLVVNESRFPDWLVAPLLMSDTSGTADAMVLLGAGVTGDCVPNNNSVRRVLLARRLLDAGRAPVAIVTGRSDQPECPVGVAMARLAREVGVPESKILVEPKARSTRENGERSATLLRRMGAERVLLVTDRLHMKRAAGVFAGLGFAVERASVPVYQGHIDNMDMLAAGAREAIALAYYRLKGWLGPVDRRPLSAYRERDLQGSRTAVTRTFPDGPVVVLGASYAGGWKLATIAGVPVINQGVAGQQSFEMLERFERDVVPAQPRGVIIWGFINDIFRGSEDIEAALVRVRESYEGMVSLSRQHGIEPVLATEVTVRPPDSWSETLSSWIGGVLGREGYQDRINRHVLELNRWIADLAKREGLRLLDLQAVLAEPDGRRRRAEFTSEDGSHITAPGYEALTAYATPILEEHFVVR